MKNINKLLFTTFLLILSFAKAQETKVNSTESKLTVYGTSNIHDWDVVAENMSGTAVFETENGILKTIKSMRFSVVSESLKSGKSGMDKNTYKALKTEKHQNIVFVVTNISKVTANANETYTVATQGNLTICGITKKINQTFTIKNLGNKFTISGKQKIDMTTYGIEPPKALMGTIKTGKEVTIDFTIIYK
ncbi:YceI family protein [Flavobacterium sp.]|uniref:YceI family protein n=1 Tax=Flavobacterium sp. TaxID=239 RepID=UPI003527797C